MKTPAGRTNASSAATTVAVPALADSSVSPTQTATSVEGTLDAALEDIPLAATTYEPPRRKILCNPSAGDVHRRERGSPWRVDVDEKIRAASAKAKDEQLEKRRWGLAKQIQDGLMHSYGMNYGVAELSTLLKTGLALRAQQQRQERQQQQQTTAVAPLASHEVAYVQLLAAAEKYDLKQVVVLLNKFPKGRNSSSSNNNSKPK